ncbi:hypothetical protein BKA62DRAFT_246405 [Auriculariales sp. MPI-PUGE-AT-0066]|nr:hypothetical protein BKA62DRAFT_246405 [Auriculariales sp. MPI-PUGE-AT-0066]
MRWAAVPGRLVRLVRDAFTTYEPYDPYYDALPFRSPRRRAARRRRWFVRLLVLVLAYILGIVLFRHLLIRSPRLYLPLPHNVTSGWHMSTTARELEAQVALEPQNAHPRHDMRYVHFANAHKNSGLNNILQEVVLLAELARQSRRALVVRPFLMDRWAAMPPQVFLAGPVVGGPFPSGDSSPRAVSMDTWEKECPPYKVHHVRSKTISTLLGLTDDSEGVEIMDRWAHWLSHLDHTCVEIVHVPPLVFDFPMVVSPRVMSLWDTMSTSPITTGFEWSPIVVRAVEKALKVINPSYTPSKSGPARGDKVIDGLAALHIRRGDFEGHCRFLQSNMQSYNSWNLMNFLPDSFDPNRPPTRGTLTEDDLTLHYQRHCWPSIAQIVLRLRQITRGGINNIRQVYVMTNGHGEWLEQLVAALRQAGWENVVTSAEVQRVLIDEESVVDQAVDMEIARRAELLIGNGFSSLTSNVVLLRLAARNDPSSIRFW